MSITLRRKAPCAILTVHDKEYHVERIGRGRYTTAWRNGAACVWLQVHEKDLSKDALADCPSNPHLPKCERFDWFDGSTPFRLYREPLYQPLMASAKTAWRDYKALAFLWNNARIAEMNKFTWRDPRTISARTSDFNRTFDDMVASSPHVPETLRDAVEILVRAAADYGDYRIEITKKNCAVGAEGQLILLDPLFDAAEVARAWDARIKKS